MRFINGHILNHDFRFTEGGFEIKNGKFVRIWEGTGDKFRELPISSDKRDLKAPKFNDFNNEEVSSATADLKGAKVIPGLIDIHIHGSNGVDFSTDNESKLVDMCKYLGINGITAFAGTVMTMPFEDMKECCLKAQRFTSQFQDVQNQGQSRLQNHRQADIKNIKGAELAALNLEGPYLSEGARGAQPSESIQAVSLEQLKSLQEAAGGMIKFLTVAPEADRAIPFIKRAADICRVCMGHTEAGYEKAMEAIEAGALQVTHLFNGMTPMHHREPGLPCAAAESDKVMAELICDGVHVHPAMIRMAFKLFENRVILISDALSPCGKDFGRFKLGKQDLYLNQGKCTLKDGTLAGSVTNLYECTVNAIKFGIPPEDAVKAASLNPAVALGMDKRIGSIALGKQADFIVCGKEYEIIEVYKSGVKL